MQAVVRAGACTFPIGKREPLKDVVQGCEMVKTIVLAVLRRDLRMNALWVSYYLLSQDISSLLQTFPAQPM